MPGGCYSEAPLQDLEKKFENFQEQSEHNYCIDVPPQCVGARLSRFASILDLFGNPWAQVYCRNETTFSG